MTESAENDAPLCEHIGCDKPGWVVLHFGPKLTPPLRTACATHQKVADLAMFRERVLPPGGSDA